MNPSEKQTAVLTFFKNMKIHNPERYDNCVYYGINIKDIVKFIERPEDCGKWPFDFVCKVIDAVNKIYNKFIIPFPKNNRQTKKDIALADFITKNNFYTNKKEGPFYRHLPIKHIIQYLIRDNSIYDWNPYYVIEIQAEIKDAKKSLNKELIPTSPLPPHPRLAKRNEVV